MNSLKPYQQRFIELAIRAQVLQLGEFRLKSGRLAPYFFNVGKIATGSQLSELGKAYAAHALAVGIEFDALFGPAYKGISIASAMATSLSEIHGRDVSVTFNRKEAKDHGEGGVLMGASVTKKMLVVDDVISDGKSKLEAAELIRSAGGQLAGVLVALDRQERGTGAESGGESAVTQVARQLGVPVLSIVNVADLLTYLRSVGRDEAARAIDQYREQYGAA